MSRSKASSLSPFQFAIRTARSSSTPGSPSREDHVGITDNPFDDAHGGSSAVSHASHQGRALHGIGTRAADRRRDERHPSCRGRFHRQRPSRARPNRRDPRHRSSHPLSTSFVLRSVRVGAPPPERFWRLSLVEFTGPYSPLCISARYICHPVTVLDPAVPRVARLG